MPRKGSTKVRSGCSTCKARKVKCDEGKPSCQRCVTAGRICHGFGFIDQITTTRLQVVQPRNHVLGNPTRNDSRVVEFFCKVVAPSLSGPIDPYFWTHIVLQFSEVEPAVRHSVMTISSLFENRQRRDKSSALAVQRNVVALKHYNAAIRELQTLRNPDLVLTLLTCLLFVCIEILHSNGDIAIRHCYHGINLLGTSDPPQWALYYLMPVFRRLSILPFYFGDSQPLANCPAMTQPSHTINSSFNSYFEAQVSIDAIYNMTIQLFRRTGEYRLGKMRYEPGPPEILIEQKKIHQYLVQWKTAFERFESETPTELTQATKTSRIWPFQQYHVCIVLSTVIFLTDETDYDEFIPNFKEMVKGAGELAGLRNRPTRSEFHFEMGFAPFLFFVAIKCREFETRIEALRLMSVLCAAQESLWNSHTLQVVAQRIIDLEHGVTTSASGDRSIPYSSLPDDSIRVRHFVVGPIKSGPDGVVGREISFYLPSEDGGIYIKREIFSLKRLNELLEVEGSPGVFAVDLSTETLLMTELND
ncbi:transcriptional regulatory [Fusarium longipes]|uniref:Transcriptional regulatory n=1 Tax=Fusarium longipes TaxID=694270 RepID=A0A395T319_9HYPO|nr:transcriptional regulatory [Fusarium longipes]